MYAGFYNLRREPFHITPDPEFLFLSPSHKQALASIIYGVEERKGFVAVVGEVGVGKTTILRSYLERVDKQDLKIIYVFNPNLPFEGLLDTILRELALEPATGDVFKMVNLLHHALIEEYKCGRNVVLIIDEAQNMPVATLEDLRMLSNLETSKDKLLQILLIGQPELENVLNRNELRQLKQRIAIYSTIKPLTADESLAYINYRLAKVALTGEPAFTAGALKLIVKKAMGIPRLMNILCDNALITGFGYEKKPVTKSIAREVIADFQGSSAPRYRRWKMALPILCIFVAVLFWGGYHEYPYTSLISRFQLNSAVDFSQKNYPRPSVVKAPSTELRKALPSIAEQSPAELGAQQPQATVLPNKELLEANQGLVQSNMPESGQSSSSAVSVEKEPKNASHPANQESDYSATVAADQKSSKDLSNHIPVIETAVQEETQHAVSLPTTLQTPEEKNTEASNALTSDKIPEMPVMRKVKKGDNLTKIAAELANMREESTALGVLIQSILEKNPQIRDADRISVGDNILLPSPKMHKEETAN